MLVTLVASGAHAQTPSVPVVPVQAPVEHLSFDRPESWALKYFTAATLVGGFDAPRTREPGSVAVGLELGWLPALSDAQRLIGFDGTKPEDLNKAPLFLRPRVVIGLPARLSLTAAIDPPIATFGVKPTIVAVALERPVYESSSWGAGVRGYFQGGHVEAAFTCPQSVLAFAPGSPSNLYGCQAVSSDTASLRYAGGEFGVAYRGARLHGLSPHASASINYMNVKFQVNALTFGFIDHTLLLSHGATFATGGGVTYPIGARLEASFDVFYAPLSVARPPSTTAVNEGLFNVRALVAYKIR